MTSPYRPLPPGMQRFRLDPAGYRSAATRHFLRQCVLVAAIALPMLGGAAFVNASNVQGFAYVTGVAAVILLAAAARKLLTIGNAIAPVLARYELLVSERVLRRSTGFGPVAEVLRAEVSEIVETNVGLWVSCAQPRRSLFVVHALDGYADVRQALSAWAPIQPLRGWKARQYARRETRYQGPRDAVIGTALASDTSLAAELEAVRAASFDGHALPGAPVVASRPGRALALWVLLIVAFLALWQVLQPAERRQVMTTDQTCRAQKACLAFGACKAEGYRCVAGSDDDCQQSEACTKVGRCKEVGGACYGEGDRGGTNPLK
jgi:hypothetical protein